MLSEVEIQTIYLISKDLNFYQLLKVSPAANDDEVRDAFHREARLFHPDRYISLNNPELTRMAKEIYSKVVEAYRTLSNNEKRDAYNERLMSKGGASDPNGFEEVTGARKRPQGPTSGSRFFKMAQAAYASGDLKGAKMNVQLALNTDPTNEEFLHFFHRLEIEMKKLEPTPTKKR